MSSGGSKNRCEEKSYTTCEANSADRIRFLLIPAQAVIRRNDNQVIFKVIISSPPQQLFCLLPFSQASRSLSLLKPP